LANPLKRVQVQCYTLGLVRGKEAGVMGEKGLQPEKIKARLREAEVRLSQGQTIEQICRKFGITEQTYNSWQKEYGRVRKDRAERSWNLGMYRKQIAIGAVLIVVVIIAAVITVRRTTSGPRPPDWVLDEQVQKIDIKSLDVAKERLGDWQGKYAADASGRFKSPKTGEYTMVDVMTCSACGQPIPVPQIPDELRGQAPNPTAMRKMRLEYKCPRCGKNPWGLLVGPR